MRQSITSNLPECRTTTQKLHTTFYYSLPLLTKKTHYRRKAHTFFKSLFGGTLNITIRRSSPTHDHVTMAPSTAAIERLILSDDALPTHYDLTLKPDLVRHTFEGSLDIKFDVLVATDEISLNYRELSFDAAVVRFVVAANQKEIKASSVTFKPAENEVVLKFAEVLPVGENVGILKIPLFHGILNDQMAGFYRSGYVGADGAKKHMAVTQFEAIDARRCFPCFDEPARKAVFKVTIEVERVGFK